MKSLSIAALVLTCAFTGCKENDPVEPSKESLLTARNWRITANVSTTTVNGTTVAYDEFADYESCQRDDFTIFSPDKSLKVNQGAVKCEESDPQEEEGTWALSPDQTKLVLTSPDFGYVTIPMEIVELTNTTMRLQVTETRGSSSYSETFTYRAF